MEESTIRKIRKDTRLLMPTKLFYIYLHDLASDSGYVHMTIRELAQETLLSTGGISAAIRQLKDNGYIFADKINDTGIGGPGSWRITIRNFAPLSHHPPPLEFIIEDDDERKP